MTSRPRGVEAGASGLTDSVSFQIAGPNSYASSLTASGAAGNFSATFNLAPLGAGPYKVTPVAVNGAGSQTCGPAFFTKVSALPSNPTIAKCASMVGTWAMAVGSLQLGTWTVTQDSPAAGNFSTTITCTNGQGNVTVTYPILGGQSSYSSKNQSINFQAGSPPAPVICGGADWASPTANITGSIIGAPLCGMGTGTFTSIGQTGTTTNTAVTLTSTERDPTSETTQFVRWLDQNGLPTVATFQMTLGPSSGVYGGRRITEQYTSNSTKAPQYQAQDGCWWANAPWNPLQLMQNITPGVWNVQSQNGSSTYGVDFVGFYPHQIS